MSDLLDIAAAVLPGQSLRGAFVAQGGSHDVVVLPDVAVVRIARKSSAVSLLPRRTELLRRLAAMDLPFAVPAPLTDVLDVDGHTAVALSWLPGTWYRTFGLEQVAFAVLNGESAESISQRCATATAWLRRTA